MSRDYLKEKAEGYAEEKAESVLDWLFKKLVWLGRRVGWLAVLGVVIILGGLIDDPERSEAEKRKERPRVLALGAGLILVSAGLRWRKRLEARRAEAEGTPQQPQEWNLGLRESVREGIRWLSRKAGGLTVFGAIFVFGGSLGLLNGENKVMGVEENKEFGPEFAGAANWGFLLGGLTMIGLQGLLQSRGRAVSAPRPEVARLAAGVYADHGLRFRHPPEWTVEACPVPNLPGAWQLDLHASGGSAQLQILPGDLAAKWVNAFLQHLRQKRGESLVFSRSSAHLGGRPTLGADFSFQGGRGGQSGQVLAACHGGQTVVLFWQAGDDSLAHFRPEMDQIRTALEWPVAAAEAVPISLASGETAVPERGVVNRPWLTFVAIFAVVVFAVTLGFVAHHRSEKMRKAGTEPAATPGKQVVVPAPDLQP